MEVMDAIIGLGVVALVISVAGIVFALLERKASRERRASAPCLPDPLETARDSIMAFYGKQGIDFDAFARTIAKAISDSCEIAVQRDRVLDGRKAAEDKRLEQFAESEHRRKIELESHRAALCEAERRDHQKTKIKAEQKPAKMKLVKGLRDGALLHLNDECQCRTSSVCSRRQREALEKAEEIEKDL